MPTPCRKNLTYQKAPELTLNLEAAAKGSKDICSQQPLQQIEPIVSYTKSTCTKQRSGKTTHPRAIKPLDVPHTKLTCYCRGEAHLASQCKFHTAECYPCHKTGHIAKVCKSRPDAKSHQSVKTNYGTACT